MNTRLAVRRLAPLRPSLFISRHASSGPETIPPPIITPTTKFFDPEVEPALAGLNYPKVYEDSRQLRSPYKKWWDSQERVNFGEQVPINDDVQSMWAPDAHKVNPFSAFSQLLTAFAAVGLFASVVYATRSPAPAQPRAYPYDGLVQELSGTEDKIHAARTLSENEVEE